MFSWGEDTKYGFGLRKLDGSNPTNHDNFIHFTNLRSNVGDLSAGQNLVVFVRGDGTASHIRMRTEPDGRRLSGKPKAVQFKEKIRVVRCGDDVAVFVSDGGNVFCMDSSNMLRPQKDLCQRQVNQVSCGGQHSIALTQGGQVFTWGMNTSGQLGLGRGSDECLPPQVLHSLSGLPLLQVTAGGDQSFALSLSGGVFTWGRNSWGQLGLGDTTDRHVPTLVTSLDKKKTVSISCGKDHAVILTKDGAVFTFGSGQYGQLGHNSLRDERRPRMVGELWGSKVTQIACGSHHTLVFVGSSNKMYSFGRGEQGQLGNGVRTNQSVPLPVQVPQESDDDQKIKRIFAGGNHSFAMTTSALDVGLVRLQTLDKEMVDKWISQCHTNSWKKIQREIKAVFSSPSCLNGSFLDKSGDKHYQTSINQSGLDLSLAREVFKKLVKKGRVLAKVETVIQQSLLSNLSKNPVGVESLRVYLVLSELLTVISEQSKANTNDLIEAVAAAILRLHTDKLKVLEDLWSSLRPSTLIKHIKMWKNTLLCHLNPPHNHPTGFKDLLNVLQHLYIASQKSGWEHRVPVSAFCMEDVVFNDQFLWGDVQRWRLWSKNKSVDGTLPIVCCYPFLMNLQSKILALNVAITHTMNQLDANCMGEKTIFGTPPPSPFFELRLRRASLIEDTFRELDATNHSTFKKPLTVYFDGDSKVTDVYRRDFFLHVFDNLVAPESEMFMYNDSKTLAWFPATPTLEEKRYFLFGILCGLALLGNTIVHLPFPLALFKKLLNIKPSFEDLMEFCPHFAERLKTILDYPDDVLEELSFSFSVAWDGRNVELDPKEPEKVVTSENKREFVEAYVNHIFNKSVELVFAEFRRGFFTVCDEDAVTLFQPEELRGVMVGKENYDWETLKQNTVYGGMYNKSHPNIVTFWEVFEELSENQKKAFLLFLTGCDRVPILGMNQIRMQVQELYNSTEHHFPEALTCHSLLQLPMYPSKETLKARLTEALCNNRGFWKE